MPRAPRWTMDEFMVVLASYGQTVEEVAGRLDSRTAGAVSWVRAGVHDFHSGTDNSILSSEAKSYISGQRGSLQCPQCGQPF
jgi:hypothetical protein